MEPHKQKTLCVCILGKSNVGKSSLLNKLVGHKISIVTPKIQTTRSMITGIVTIKDTQIVIFDTPGIFTPEKPLEHAMVRCAWSSIHSADRVLIIIDHSKVMDDLTIQIIQRLQALRLQLIFILNKIDLSSMYDHTSYLLNINKNIKIFRISALLGEGTNELLTYLVNIALPSPWLYEKDEMTTASARFLAAEITREQLFLQLRDELPYNLTIYTELWQENIELNSIKINQVIIVPRESHKTIILGKNGSRIKSIGSQARLAIESLLDRKIHLFLFIKICSLWEQRSEFYQEMGLRFKMPDRSKH